MTTASVPMPDDNDGIHMRRLLDFLYDGAAWLAALAMIGVLLMVLLSVVSRELGFQAAGTDAYAGYSMAAAVFLSGLFAFYSVRLAWVSHAINDISTSNDATPLWIPQIAMGLGAVILFIAFVDEWVLELRGQRKANESEEALHNE
jgi:TRAP-type C4-dicarboxylate transport system permease small subunit